MAFFFNDCFFCFFFSCPWRDCSSKNLINFGSKLSSQTAVSFVMIKFFSSDIFSSNCPALRVLFLRRKYETAFSGAWILLQLTLELKKKKLTQTLSYHLKGEFKSLSNSIISSESIIIYNEYIMLHDTFNYIATAIMIYILIVSIIRSQV